MIRNWRTDWKQGDFPFGIVQIAPFRYNWAMNGEACRIVGSPIADREAYAIHRLIVTTDIGNMKTSIRRTSRKSAGGWRLGPRHSIRPQARLLGPDLSIDVGQGR